LCLGCMYVNCGMTTATTQHRKGIRVSSEFEPCTLSVRATICGGGTVKLLPRGWDPSNGRSRTSAATKTTTTATTTYSVRSGRDSSYEHRDDGRAFSSADGTHSQTSSAGDGIHPMGDLELLLRQRKRQRQRIWSGVDASCYPTIAMMGGRPPPWMGLPLKLLPRGRDPSNGRFQTSSAGAASGAYTNDVNAVQFQAWTTGR
jgi:hypothetical protein